MQAPAGNDDFLGLNDDLPLYRIIGGPKVRVPGGPDPFHAIGHFSTTLLVEKNPVDVVALQERGACLGRIRQPRFSGALLSGGMAAHGAISAVVLAIASILGHRLGGIAQFTCTFKDNAVAVVVFNVLGVHAHPVTDPIQGLLELQGREEWQTGVRPLLADITLCLQRSRPIHRTSTSPSGSRQHGHGPVVAHGGTTTFEQVHETFVKLHREMFGRVLIAFFHNQHTMAGFSQVLGRNTASAATTHNNHIGFDYLRIIARGDLQEFVFGAIDRYAVDRDARETHHGADGRTHSHPGLLENSGKAPVDSAHGFDAGRFPPFKNLLTELERLICDGSG